MNITIDIPKLYSFLLEPSRYKVAYGGRGSLKTWSAVRASLLLSTLYNPNYSADEIEQLSKQFADQYQIKPDLIALSCKQPHKILCTREIQDSIKKSIHSVVVDQIRMLNLTDLFPDPSDNAIRCINGSEYTFEGLRKGGQEHNIKGIEGTTICLIEEAENVSDKSYKYLRPTIRREGSEIWVIFNTRYEDDPTYKEFVLNPPRNAIVKFINIEDVPPRYQNKTLLEEYQNDLRSKPKAFVDNVWRGLPTGAGRKVWQEFVNMEYPDGHIREFDWQLVKERANCFMVMDPAQHYYPACIWIALIPRNQKCDSFYKWVYAEWPTFADFGDYFCNVRKSVLYTKSLADMAREIYVKDGTAEHGLKISRRFIDTRFVKGSGSGNYYSGQTMGLIEQFAKSENGGLVFSTPAEKMIDSQKNALNLDMQWNKLMPVCEINEPAYFVAPWCINTIDAMSNHRLEDDKEAELELRKDFSDCHKIGWAGLSDWRYKDPSPKPKTTKPVYQGSASDSWMSM